MPNTYYYKSQYTGAEIEQNLTIAHDIGQIAGIVKMNGINPSAAVAGTDYGFPMVTGSGAPTTSTEGEVGQHYLNTSATEPPYEYICVGMSGDYYLWVEVGSGSGGGGLSAYIRYSAYADGTGFTTTWTEGQNYVGFATGETAPTVKTGYTWCLFKGSQGIQGNPGTDGTDGEDGFSPVVSTSAITGGHTLSVQDATHTEMFNVMDGAKGDPGEDGTDGTDGYSPSASVVKVGSVATITITDKDGTTTATVSDGSGAGTITSVKMNGQTIATAGEADLGTVITAHQDISGKADKSNTYTKTEVDSLVNAKYTKPGMGIPKADLASAVQTSLGLADTALQSHQSLADYATIAYVDGIVGNVEEALEALR